MTFTDFVSKSMTSLPAESLRRSSLNGERPEKHHKNQTIKKLHTSVLDLLHGHRPIDTLENNTMSQQQEGEPSPRRPSIIKTSDIERVLTRKSVTFASVFDLGDNEHAKDDATSNIETNPIRKMTSEEDLVTVIVNKQFNDEITNESSETIEPYPFRSEIPISPYSSLSNDVTTTSNHSRKKIIHRFIPQNRPKKLRHPLEITNPASPINRSRSAPDLIISSPFPPPSTTTTTITNNQQRPLKSIRRWFKLSTVRRFFRSFSKNSHKNRNTPEIKAKSYRRSTSLGQFPEVIY